MKFLDKLFPHRIWKKRLNDLRKRQLITNLPAFARTGRIGKKKFWDKVDKVKLFKYAAIGSFIGLVLLVLTGIAAFAWFAKDLPQPDKIVRKEGFATKIFDRNGKS